MDFTLHRQQQFITGELHPPPTIAYLAGAPLNILSACWPITSCFK